MAHLFAAVLVGLATVGGAVSASTVSGEAPASISAARVDGPTLRSVASASTRSGTRSLTLSRPAGVAAGDVMIAAVGLVPPARSPP